MIFSDVIEFACDSHIFGAIPEPKPANKFLPDWYKKIKPHNGVDQNKFPIRTVKKCMPVLDAMSLGYIIPLPTDLHAITNHDLSYIKVNTRRGEGLGEVEMHDWCQIESEKWPVHKQSPIKFTNPWFVKTKPGWSCLFTSPINHIGAPFEIMSGVVDTDKYDGIVQLPAVWLTPNFDGILEAGMPLAHVIPFKRNKEKLKIRAITEKEQRAADKTGLAALTRADVYKNEYREPR